MQPKTILTALILSGVLPLSGCNGITEEERQWLIDRTRQNLVFVEGGTFWMGDVGYVDAEGYRWPFTGDYDTRPVHQVTLDSFSIQKFETTYAEFDLFSKAIGEEKIAATRRYQVYRQPEYSAWGMDWYQARAYCQWLGSLLNLPMDLPTEAQWEYAARSRGLAVAHATDNGDIEYGRNYRDPTVIDHEMPPGSWPPNPLGIYDMTGNVSEWVLDWYAPYTPEPKVNPTGPAHGNDKVWRGFGVIGGKGIIQLYRRGHVTPTSTGGGHGVRCVVNQPTPVK